MNTKTNALMGGGCRRRRGYARPVEAHRFRLPAAYRPRSSASSSTGEHVVEELIAVREVDDRRVDGDDMRHERLVLLIHDRPGLHAPRTPRRGLRFRDRRRRGEDPADRADPARRDPTRRASALRWRIQPISTSWSAPPPAHRRTFQQHQQGRRSPSREGDSSERVPTARRRRSAAPAHHRGCCAQALSIKFRCTAQPVPISKR